MAFIEMGQKPVVMIEDNGIHRMVSTILPAQLIDVPMGEYPTVTLSNGRKFIPSSSHAEEGIESGRVRPGDVVNLLRMEMSELFFGKPLYHRFARIVAARTRGDIWFVMNHDLIYQNHNNAVKNEQAREFYIPIYEKMLNMLMDGMTNRAYMDRFLQSGRHDVYYNLLNKLNETTVKTRAAMEQGPKSIQR